MIGQTQDKEVINNELDENNDKFIEEFEKYNQNKFDKNPIIMETQNIRNQN